jgi:hypothetical protein
MPYKIVRDHSGCPKGKRFAVLKASDSKLMGCHETRESAEDQIAAIEANEKG